MNLMPIPDMTTIQLPLLKLLADRKEHSYRETLEQLGKTFHVSDEERTQLIPSGLKRTFDTRVLWAISQLRNAGLLENTERGIFKITDRGLTVLKENPAVIDNKYLRQFPEFLEFLGAVKSDQDKSTKEETVTEETEKDGRAPLEVFEESYQQMRQNLARDLLNYVKNCSPDLFERLVVQLLVKMGYGGSEKEAGKALGKSHDGGIDGVIKKDVLGLDVIYIQAKRWKDTVVGRPEIDKFVGALDRRHSRDGIFITTSKFTTEASQDPSTINHKVVLIDGNQLAEFMIDYGIGVSTDKSYEMKKMDPDYFADL